MTYTTPSGGPTPSLSEQLFNDLSRAKRETGYLQEEINLLRAQIIELREIVNDIKAGRHKA